MAGQRFTLTFDAQLNIGQMKGAIGNIQSELNKLQLPQNLTKGISGTLNSLEKEIRNFEVASGKDLGNKNNFNALERSAEKIDSLFKDLQIQARDLGSNVDLSKFFPQSIVSNIQKGKQALEEYNKTLKKLEQDQVRAQKNLTSAQNKQTVAKDNLDTQKAELEKFQQQYESTLNQIYTKVKMQPEDIFDTKSIEQAMQKTEELFAKYKNIQEGVNSKGKPYAQSTKITAAKQQAELEQLINTYKQLATAIPEAEKAQKSLETAYTNATNKVKEMQLALEQAKTATEGGQVEAIRKVFEQLNAAGIDTSGFQQNLAGAQAALEAYARVAEGEAAAALEKFNEAIRDNSNALENNKSDMDGASNSFRQFNDQVREIDSVKSRIKYFLGLNNVINLVKRAIHGAVDTIKELDKAMTATAVVTDFTVSDMWKQLPEYTKRANELGVTTQAAYEAATLYYQQGLNTEEVNALSVETLKMARIAGLDAAEATDRMTNALRGFNMELDTANAQRVDDVYSELAANTASNVDEISTAMTKVASLAHSANMEFETTAAFLAQIIETTRESAETAGTALKTVVARFSEVKKLFDEGDIRGQDEEGQVIDVNKVGAALRTAGIDLNKYFLGEVGLDDIFMELASKWDSLTSVQQRYIATQAAGSRQQSRFIALMQDYARTQELVGKAYNAEGASARQFAKTQDSLESKLARLKNAWNEFLMGLTNNVMVKSFVDILTNLLNVVNNLTSAFGEGAGTILKWVAAAGAIGGLRRLFADGGLATRVIGGFMGHGLGANKIRETLGLGTLDERGQYSAYSRDELRANRGPTIIGNIKGLGAGLKNFGSKAWTSAGALGSIFGLEGTAAGIAGIATALGAVTAAAAAAYGAYQLWLHTSAEGKLKLAKKEVENLSESYDEEKSRLESLTSLQESYNKQTLEIRNATSAADREAAIEERNKAVLDAIEADGTLAKYVVTERIDDNIVLTVDEDALSNAIKDAADRTKEAEIQLDFGDAKVDFAEANVAEKKLRNIAARSGSTFDYDSLKTPEEVLDQILQDQWVRPEDRSKAAELYSTIVGSRASAEKQAEVAYGKLLIQQGANQQTTEDLTPILAEAFLKTGKQLTGDEISNLLKESKLNDFINAFQSGDLLKDIAPEKWDIESDEFLSEAFKLTESQLQKFASQLGYTTDELKTELKNRLKSEKAIRSQQKVDIYDRILRSGAANERYTIGVGDEENYAGATTAIDNYEAFLSKIDAEGIASIDKITSQAEELLGDKFGQFMTDLPELYGSAQFNSIQNLFNKINLDKPIQAYKELNAYISQGNDVKGYANAIKTANAEIFTSSSLVQSFIASADYESITDQLQDFIKTNKGITADNIEELADSCEDLSILLDEDIANAEALAEAFTLLEQGKITFDEITDALLAALGAGKSFEQVIADVNNWMDYDKGTDLTKGAESVISDLEELQKYVDNWEFGNEPIANIYDHIFGEGKYQENILDQYFGPDQADPAKAEAVLSESIAELTNWFQNDGLGAINQAFATGKVRGLSSLGDNLFTWDLSQIGSTTEAINQVADSLNITQGAAEALILSWQTHIPGLRTEWDNLKFDEALEAFASKLDGTAIVTEQELQTLATATGHSVDEIKAKLGELSATGTIQIPIIVNWQDKDGNELTGDALYNKFISQFGSARSNGVYQVDWGKELANTVITQFEDGIQGYDPSQVLKYFTDKGLSGAQATEMANRAVKDAKGQFAQEIEVPVVYKTEVEDANGELQEIFKTDTKTITVTADTVEGLDAAINTAMDAANYENVATAIASQDFSGLTQSIFDAGKAGGDQAKSYIQGQINSIDTNITVRVEYQEINRPAKLSTGAIIEYEGDAHGGIAKSYAKGSENFHVSAGTALTGEEGPELVWNKEKGYSYLTGESGPEFQNLQPGDRIFNAAETKKILKNSSAATGGVVPSYAAGGWKDGEASGGSGSGRKKSGSDKEKTPEEWKNELDWLYNLMEDIAELERQQTELEERYEDLLTDEAATGHDLYKLLVQQLGNLYTQLNHQTFALEKREQEMREFMDITNDKDQYLWYNWDDRTLEIDWDAIDRITDEEEYTHVKELVDEAEDIQDKMDDAEDAIQDIQNQIEELENIWRDTFTDFEKRVYEAIVKSYQDVIDNYSELNDTLNNSNQAILDSLQKEISLQRQIRDNTKTEEQIADSEAQLAYMRRDTTGGNALAALELEKQLAEDRESYEDTLVDQAISRLSEDNSAAAEQREHQIEIMQAQLDYAQENGEYWNMVTQLIADATGDDGQLLTNTRLEQLLQNNESWEAMSETQQAVWEEELNTTFKEVVAYLLKENSELNGTFYTALTAAVDTVGAAIGSYSQAVTKLGNQVSAAASSGGGGGGGGYSGSSSSSGSGGAQPRYSNYDDRGFKLNAGYAWDLDKKIVVKRYATGGLASNTGLAWLDGTPSEPEYVLNARQTDAFLKLADVLPSIMGPNGATTNTFGAMYLNFDINVDQLASDYDVDQLVNRIKSDIYDAASFRGVNVLNLSR